MLLWGAGIYNWFDPLTLLRAVDRLRHRRPDVRLFFMGLKHPNPDIAEIRMAVAARELSDRLGLTGTDGFFNEGWVDYDDCQNYLLDADIGVSTHLDHIETAMSFRTRVLDYLWCSLPTVATRGDSLAEVIEAQDLGLTVPAAAYFPLDRVLDGLLDITGEVFGLTYEPVDLPVWHRDVRSLTIVDRASGERIATAHMDLHPRDGKFGHAAAWDLVPGHRGPDGAYVAPVSAIVANFTKPTPERPSLLTHDEVVTLFHEFGHVLHQTLTRAELVEFAGTSVERDFVEAPSQIMEHWCWQPEVLTRFARHHETGKPIPAELVEQLTAARDLNVAMMQLRQMQLGVLDMGFHGPRRPGESRPDGSRDLDAITERAGRLSGLPLQEGTFMAASFGHLLSGYDAGYYGYMWSEVFGDDMFSRFAADGLTSAAVGGEYRAAILERGGTADAIELIRQFLRREPNNKAFLDKLGIAA